MIAVAAAGDSAINIAVKPWVNVTDYGKAISAVNQGVIEEFRRRGISIPFPQREVRMLAAA
jgi:small conductance mechanosensitive channel